VPDLTARSYTERGYATVCRPSVWPQRGRSGAMGI